LEDRLRTKARGLDADHVHRQRHRDPRWSIEGHGHPVGDPGLFLIDTEPHDGSTWQLE
jgi:hypothetical protein